MNDIPKAKGGKVAGVFLGMSFAMALAYDTHPKVPLHDKSKSEGRICCWESDRVFGGLGKELGAGSASWAARCRLLLNSPLLPTSASGFHPC